MSSFSVYGKDRKIICSREALCEYISSHFYSRFEKLSKENILKFASLNSHIKRVSETKNGDFYLDIRFNSTDYELYIEDSKSGIVEAEEFKRVIRQEKNRRLDSDAIERSASLLKGYLIAKGYKNFDLTIFESIKAKKATTYFVIKVGSPLVLNRIKFDDSFSKLNLQGFKGRLAALEAKPFNQLEFRIILQEMERKIIGSGYLYSKVNYSQEIDAKGLVLRIDVQLGARVQFSVSGNKIFTKYELLKALGSAARSKLSKLDKLLLVETIENKYRKSGFYFTKVGVRTIAGRTKDERPVTNYYLNIEEGHKLEISTLAFRGNEFFKREDLVKMLNENSSELVSSGYFDESSLKYFANLVKLKYQRIGFVDIDIDGPEFVFDDSQKFVNVSFYISEGKQYIIDDFTLCDDCPIEFQEDIERSLMNREKSPVNIHEIDEDFKRALSEIKERGHFLANVDINKQSELVKFDGKKNLATLKFPIERGALIKLNSVHIEGLEKTREYVVRREVLFKKGELITPSTLNGIQSRINSLGLFQFVSVKPVDVSDKNLRNTEANEVFLDLLISVKEKDFGAGEIAVGYRTDIGARSAASLVYNNFFGRNWIGSLDAQTNYRFSFSSLDRDRSPEQNKFAEWGVNSGFTFPYFFSVPMSTNLSLAFKKQRYFAFDAKIIRFSYNNSYTFFDKLNINARYQFDTIDQFAASEEIDNDSFKIGSITPSISLDLRDRSIDPRSGAFFSVSWEFANSYFNSQDEADLSINYNRLVTRTKFYLPLTPKLVLATAISYGVAVNFANQKKLNSDGTNQTYGDGTLVRDGYIPSIRVFRLDGQDTIRGFTDSEINLLDNGQDIGDVIVNDRVYFNVFKTELRYAVSDAVRVGLFFDAGKIHLKTHRPMSLRTSLGITTKFVTPVGSLDFDFGVKARRKRFDNGNQEEFGRMHFSIGFF